MLDRGRELAHVHRFAAAQDAEPFDHVVQLADVPRPRIREQRRDGPAREAWRGYAVFRRELCDELQDQRPDVGASFAQRGDRECDALDAIEEVGPEGTASDAVLEGPQGRGDEADVSGDLGVAAHAHESAVFEEPEELGLHRQRQLTDLVEEQSAPRRSFHLSSGELVGAGEGPALVAEELALEERFGDRRTVDRHERLRPAG
jgi:hypothetical protein